MTIRNETIRALALTVMESNLEPAERRYLLGILTDSFDRDTQDPHPVRCDCSACIEARNESLVQVLDEEGRV